MASSSSGDVPVRDTHPYYYSQVKPSKAKAANHPDYSRVAPGYGAVAEPRQAGGAFPRRAARVRTSQTGRRGDAGPMPIPAGRAAGRQPRRPDQYNEMNCWRKRIGPACSRGRFSASPAAHPCGGCTTPTRRTTGRMELADMIGPEATDAFDAAFRDPPALPERGPMTPNRADDGRGDRGRQKSGPTPTEMPSHLPAGVAFHTHSLSFRG